ncbi:shikimate dehydrogenase [Schaalia odontolytica]|uniref:Shikimate dehydrogenase n=1 Tax=Schaalia odontolytica TaxID=1660 RepID=A0A2X0VSB8_9ACTO|nr:shikimate dehydrogenase [Schaalia odontolytica]WMS27335.1 shikimate dehydrogenase [Schaalia odontolytica]SPT56541.1 Shikimate dehydrogenase [Schaalia odontolytica]
MTWAAVIGSPIRHSLSPVIHRAAWVQLGIDGWEYRRLERDGDSLPGLIAGLGDDCAGLSVTMPCKQAIMALLDVIDPLASAVGAVNTVVPSSGVLAGFNTDVTGISSAVRRACSMANVPLPRSALVLGARATASSALAGLGELGITASTVAARRFGGPGSVVAAASRLGVSIEQVLWSDIEAVDRAAHGVDLIISTLPASAADPLAERLNVREGQILLDVVYAPRQTALRSTFEKAGGIVAEGTDMLVYQAAAQVQLMTGRSPDTGVMRDALEEELERRSRVGLVP